MSNETDLDWLARNVHKWPDKTPHVVMEGDDLFEHGAMFCESHVVVNAGTTWQPLIVCRQQWLARHAELQNKPSWKDAPAQAAHMAQEPHGVWTFFADQPFNPSQAHNDGWRFDGFQAWSSNVRGEVLGDWRDTLDRRPEKFKPSNEDANRLAQEFNPFTSIEDNQEQEMKQDNGWFERGELPPVGVECEMKRIDGRWQKAVTVGKDSGGRMVCELNDNGVFYASASAASRFRPIRTERDKLIRLIKTLRNTLRSDGEVADTILAAGFKLETK